MSNYKIRSMGGNNANDEHAASSQKKQHSREVSQTEVTPAERYCWEKWKVQPNPAHELSKDNTCWGVATCLKCEKDGVRNSVLKENDGGRFICLECGHRGDASCLPEDFTGDIDLSEIQWKEAPMHLFDAIVNPYEYETKGATDIIDKIKLVLCPTTRNDDNDPDPESVDNVTVLLPCIGSDNKVEDLWFIPLSVCESDAGYRIAKGLRIPYGWERVCDKNEDVGAVTITRSLFDLLSLVEAGAENVLCVPPDMEPDLPEGAGWKCLRLMEPALKYSESVTLAFQKTSFGADLEREISRRIGRDRCYRIQWSNGQAQTFQSAKDVMADGGAALLHAIIQEASPYPVSGIHELRDVYSEYDSYYEMGFPPGNKVGLPSLDMLYRVPTGSFTLIHGIPGHGKSTLVDEIVTGVAKRWGWKIGVLSPENQPIARHFASFSEKYIGKSFTSENKMSLEEKERAKYWVDNHIKMILPDDEKGDWTVDGIMALARTMVYRYGIRGLVIDPWNELNHNRGPGQMYEEYLAQSLSKITRFAKMWDIHIWIVAHPVKLEHKRDNRYPVPTPYTVSGGAMWFNKADFMLVPYRHRGDVDEDIVDIYVQKVRQKEHGSVGRTCLRYDTSKNIYLDDVDHEKRGKCLTKKESTPTEFQLLPTERDRSA